MAKRDTGKAKLGDVVDTPPEAVRALVPHLTPSVGYVEPFAGKGALIGALNPHGLRCVSAFDTEPRADWVKKGDFFTDLPMSSFVVSNPPYSRLIDVVDHLIDTASTAWLLIPADKLFNANFSRAVNHASRVVPIGRVRWIEGSKNTSYENFAWVRFKPRVTGGPQVFPRVPQVTAHA